MLGPVPETATGRGREVRLAGTYSLRLRLRACLVDESRRTRFGMRESSPELSCAAYDLPRERGASGLSICDESLNRRLDALRDAIDELRDKDGRSPRRHGNAPPIGDGNGVMSAMAFNWGDDMIDAGEREPALETAGAIRARRLGVR